MAGAGTGSVCGPRRLARLSSRTRDDRLPTGSPAQRVRSARRPARPPGTPPGTPRGAGREAVIGGVHRRLGAARLSGWRGARRGRTLQIQTAGRLSSGGDTETGPGYGAARRRVGTLSSRAAETGRSRLRLEHRDHEFDAETHGTIRVVRWAGESLFERPNGRERGPWVHDGNQTRPSSPEQLAVLCRSRMLRYLQQTSRMSYRKGPGAAE